MLFTLIPQNSKMIRTSIGLFFVALCSVSLILGAVNPDDVTFYLFTEDIDNTELYDNNLGDVDVALPTILIIHGWVDTSNDSWVERLTDAYLATGDYNIITVDWSPIANLSYFVSVADVKLVGNYVGDLIIDLYTNHSANLSDFHLVGHSLGAHVAGFAGKVVQNTVGTNVGRITGLDPAGPLYRLASAENRLAETDADLVVALHTDGGAAGYWQAIGDVDFYANGGFPQQPGCSDILTSCSHERSTLLFIESVYNPSGFVSTECDSYFYYLLDACNEDQNVTLGGDLTINDAGEYFFKTNSQSPYSLE